ncbi:MAG: DUF4835 family protein [Bacteroidetes bacterium]|nr:DUF4835 family protein [Bacteroidota bacterium]MBP6402388.1 DUF4835 family protein [Bacteroidia bacterium]MBK6837896.1 DUF4835 family protein [Bacteroidota bacterium]MBK9526042.1 DUF4835 family protein [Bacteroidota bacterium]MBK9542489.1 DUF4835 family protein [Bacteroidota bacterium]
MVKRIVFLLVLTLGFGKIFAQELNCQVSVLTPQIQASDKSIYETLQTTIREFMNSRTWTTDQFLNQERIECSIIITISERASVDDFKANIQIQSRRPVYKTSYNSPLFNHQDNDFNFRYVQDQTLEFDEANINSNLTAVLAYYAYLIIGLDYDSFSPDGGSPYFSKAQAIVSNAQVLSERGWKAFESSRNRYWITENMLNVSFKPLRSAMYAYHRQGFDKLSDDQLNARAAVTEAIKELRRVYNDKPNSFLMQVFFNAKCDEIINLYSQAPPDEKSQVVQVLTQIDPANTLKYQGILTGTGGK